MIIRVSSRGRITIPAQERRRLGIRPNSQVEIIPRDGEIVIRPLKSVLEVAGGLRRYAKFPVPDWDEVRSETQRKVAEEVMDAARRSGVR